MEIIINPNYAPDAWEYLSPNPLIRGIDNYRNYWAITFAFDQVAYTSEPVREGKIVKVTQYGGISYIGVVIDALGPNPFRPYWAVIVTVDKNKVNIQPDLNTPLTSFGVEFARPDELYTIDGEFNLELNVRIFDLKELKRSSTYTKSIDIPFTENNNRIFSQLYNVNIDSGFNPKLKNDCKIIDGGLLIVTGYLQLQEIDIPNKIYRCVFYGENKNLFDDIGDKFIFGNNKTAEDLNFDDIRHSKYKNTLEASWNGNLDYVYGLINTETEVYTENYLKGFGPGATYGVQPNNWKAWIRLKYIIDKIFSKYGYTYESDFFNSDEFNNIFVLPSVLQNSNSSVINWNINNPPSFNYNLNKGIDTTLQLSTLKSDPYGSFNTTTNEFTIPYSDNFAVSLMLNFFNNAKLDFTVSQYGSMAAALQAARNAQELIRITPIVVRGGIEIFRSNTWYNAKGAIQSLYGGSPRVQIGYSVVPVNRIQIQNQEIPIQLLAGDLLRFSATLVQGTYSTFTTIGNKWTINVIPNSQDLFPDEPVDFIQLESTRDSVNPIAFFSKIKQIDVLGDAFRMFNLYIKPDRENQRKFLIEPRDDFYNKGKVISNLEYDRSDYTISYLIDLASKKYNFSYASGDDDRNKRYTDFNRGRIFGDALVELDNDFVNNEIKIDLVACPTISDVIGVTLSVFLPSIINGSKSGKLRYQYYNGKVNISPEVFRYNLWTSATFSAPFTYSYYPGFSNYLDFADYNSHSILWRTNNTDLNDNSLYFNYWSNEIDTYADKNSHVLTLKVKINSGIFNNIDFNDIYYFEIEGNSHYYTLLSIENYDPAETTICTMKFLSYLDKKDPRPKRKVNLTGGMGLGSSEQGNPTGLLTGAPPPGGGIVSGGDGMVLAAPVKSGVYAGSNIAMGNNSNFVAIGDELLIESGRNDIYIFGGNNLMVKTDNIISWGGDSVTYSVTNTFNFNNYNPVINENAPTQTTDGMIIRNGDHLEVYSNGTFSNIAGKTEQLTEETTGETNFNASNTYEYFLTATASYAGTYLVTANINVILGTTGSTNPIFTLVVETDGSDGPEKISTAIAGSNFYISLSEVVTANAGDLIKIKGKSTQIPMKLQADSTLNIVKII